MIALSVPLAQGVGGDRAMDLQNLGGIGGVGPRPVFGDRTLATPPYGCASFGEHRDFLEKKRPRRLKGTP